MKRALVLLALLLSVTGSTAAPAGAAGTTSTAKERLQAIELSIVARLNATRAARGLRPLALSVDLQSAALAHSRSMLDNGYFEHESRDGSPFSLRLRRFYSPAGFRSWSVGENLLYTTGDPNAAKVVKAWLASPPHRDNLLSPQWREVGVGAVHAGSAGGAFGGSNTVVVTMDFGARTGTA